MTSLTASTRPSTTRAESWAPYETRFGVGWIGWSRGDGEIRRIVTQIARGETMTYAEVAAAVGRPGAARAVGSAMARNPIAPIVPCHRVVGSDGDVRGYGGGVALKRALLDMERADA